MCLGQVDVVAREDDTPFFVQSPKSLFVSLFADPEPLSYNVGRTVVRHRDASPIFFQGREDSFTYLCDLAVTWLFQR